MLWRHKHACFIVLELRADVACFIYIDHLRHGFERLER